MVPHSAPFPFDGLSDVKVWTLNDISKIFITNMKIIINESRILDIAYMWLKTKYSDLRIRDNGDIDRSYRIHYYVNDDGGVIFEYYPKFKKVWVSQYYVYGTLASMFGLDWGQSTEIIAKWLGEEYSIYPNRIFNYDDIEIVGE